MEYVDETQNKTKSVWYFKGCVAGNGTGLSTGKYSRHGNGVRSECVDDNYHSTKC